MIVETEGQKVGAREELIEIIKAKHFRVIGIFLDQKPQFCLHISAFLKSLPDKYSAKNIKQIKSFFEGLQRPKKGEGFDELFFTK